MGTESNEHEKMVSDQEQVHTINQNEFCHFQTVSHKYYYLEVEM